MVTMGTLGPSSPSGGQEASRCGHVLTPAEVRCDRPTRPPGSRTACGGQKTRDRRKMCVRWCRQSHRIAPAWGRRRSSVGSGGGRNDPGTWREAAACTWRGQPRPAVSPGLTCPKRGSGALARGSAGNSGVHSSDRRLSMVMSLLLVRPNGTNGGRSRTDR